MGKSDSTGSNSAESYDAELGEAEMDTGDEKADRDNGAGKDDLLAGFGQAQMPPPRISGAFGVTSPFQSDGAGE